MAVTIRQQVTDVVEFEAAVLTIFQPLVADLITAEWVCVDFRGDNFLCKGKDPKVDKLIAGSGEVKVGSDVLCGLETRLSVIQALIPLGLEAVSDVLQQEVG